MIVIQWLFSNQKHGLMDAFRATSLTKVTLNNISSALACASAILTQKPLRVLLHDMLS
jgi:hypothetical protein